MSADSQLLCNIYVLLQDLMKEHINIDHCLKDISLTNSQDSSFKKIAAHAELIMQKCSNIEKIVSPRQCCCCKQILLPLKNPVSC